MKENKKNRRDIIVKIVAIILIIGGFFAVMYPYISNYLYQQRQNKLLSVYDDMVSTDNGKAQAEQMLSECQEYNSRIFEEYKQTNKIADLFAEYELDDAYSEYCKLLSIGNNGEMCSLEIPQINVNLVVYHGTDNSVLSKGVGHIPGSSLPVGGKSTHCVLTGHTGLTTRTLFTDLSSLKIGDIFYIHVLGEVHAYQIDDIKTVLPEEVNNIAIEEDKDYVTLVTCTPLGINTHRLLVRGTRIAYEEAKEIEPKLENYFSVWSKEYIKALKLGIILALILISVCTAIYFIRFKYKKSQSQ